jgi:type II secretory ATPase GspE/PulE/Tfp pilus assembly ATPase PilB-like protein
MAKGYRITLMVVVVVATVALGAGVLCAADGEWPIVPLDKNFRGPGGYLSVIKILACWLVFWLWVHTTDWVSTDCQELKMDYLRWNPIVVGVFMAAFILLWMIPLFWLGLSLLLIAYIAPLTAYIVVRNKGVDNDRRVLTAEHIRFWTATHLKKLGVNIAVEKRGAHEKGAPVSFIPQGGADAPTNNARLLLARQSPGFGTAREIFAEGLAGRASAIMLDYSPQGVAVQIMVDGVWLSGQARPRETGDPALESLKLLCGLNPKDRQSRQAGNFSTEYESVRYATSFTAQGTPTGERVVIQFDDTKIRFKTLEELGMRTKLQEQFLELLNLPKGFLLLSASPGNGLRTTTDVALHACDRYVREFAAVEEEDHRYPAVENIVVKTYKASENESPADVLPKLFRTEPHAVVCRDLVNAETVGLLCKEVELNRLLIGTVRAKDSAEALLRVLAMGVPAADFAKAISGVVCQRLVRKLCESCKEAYAPPPQVLQQLGIPAGRVQAFYRPPQPNPEGPAKQPCQACGGIGYMGRTAIFEVLSVGETVRKALAAGAKLEVLRQAARKDGMKNFQEEGILLVVKGVTSLPELMRILK